MNDDTAEALKGVGLFAQVPGEIVEHLVARSVMTSVASGEWLFREGDPSDHLYFVVSGRLEVVVESPNGSRRHRLLYAGDVVGELGVLTGARRSLSVRALRDSELLRTGRSAIEALYEEAPGFAAAMIRAVASHIWQPSRPDVASSKSTTVAVLIDDENLPADECKRLLLDGLRRFSVAASLEARDIPAGESPSRLLDRMERENDVTILFAPLQAPEVGRLAQQWWDFCLRQADSVVAIASRHTPPPSSLSRIAAVQVAFAGRAGAFDIARWLDEPSVTSHHHLGDDSQWPLSFGRLARKIVGRSFGIVLSGGGARGFAHIGVLEVLLDAGVPIDRIGGCSMGAFVGALAANGASPTEIRETCRRELVAANPFNDYTLPRASVIRARRAEAMMRRVFGSSTFEETPIPCFAVSCDLAAAETVVHRRGPLYWAVGVSMSIPGLVPPAMSGDKILVDGGVLDNLPVDLMSRLEGPIVAVDVMEKSWRPRMVSWEVRPGAPGLRAHAALLAGRGRAKVPSLAETLARTTVIGSWRLAQENRALADVLIAPAVGGVGVLDFRRLDEMVRLGRAAAIEALDDIEALVAGPPRPRV
jgi:predicted acylesterase/phospholipase RssA/CRP-like cAMP-binding protein